MRAVKNDEGRTIVLTRNGEIALVDDRGREIESYDVPTGAMLMVEEGDEGQSRRRALRMEPLLDSDFDGSRPVRFASKTSSKARRCELEREPSGNIRMMIIDHKGDLHPQIVIEDAEGKPLDVQYLPERAMIIVKEGDDDPARYDPRRNAA